jgi:hypothetical protein
MGIFVGALVAVVLAVIGWWVFSTLAAGRMGRQAEQQHAPGDPHVETLRYVMPDGQDPAVVISTLDSAGYTADLDVVAGDKQIVIACPAGRDRERARVRSVLGASDTTSLEGPQFTPGRVTFEDEK